MDLGHQSSIRRLLSLFAVLLTLAVTISLLPLAALDWERVCESREREIVAGYQFARGLIQERIVAARLLAEQAAQQPQASPPASGQATILVLSADGNLLYSSSGKSLPRLTGLAGRLMSSPLSGIEVDSAGALVAVGTCPAPGRLIVAALPFTRQDAEAIQDTTGLESSFFAGQQRVVTTLHGQDGQLATSSPLPDAEWQSLVAQAGRLRWVNDPALAGRSYLRLLVPLYGVDGTLIGAYGIYRPVTQHLALLWQRAWLWLAVPLVSAGLIAAFTLWLGRRLVLPLRRAERGLAEDCAARTGLAELDGLLTEIRRLRAAHDALARKNEELSKQMVQAQALASLGQLAAGVAHDLNNPLTTIMGLADILQSGDLDAEARHDLTVIRRQAERGGRMVRSLLGFARRQRAEPQWVSLNDTITQTLELLAYQARVSNIQCEARLDKDLPLTWADPAQIQQVLFNIINNAFQAMAAAHKRGRLIVESTWARPTPGAPHGRIVIGVQDDGPGIPADVLPRLFQPYFTTKEPGDGTGLGLAIASSIVTRHSGRIWVENNPEGGACFYVELPVTPEPPQATASQLDSPVPANGLCDILLADSDPQRVSLLSRILRRQGYVLWTAGDGLLAQSKMEMERFDLVLCALEMSRLDGRELYSWARAQHPELAGRFVFIAPADLSAEAAAFLQDAGAPVLQPPFEEEAVVALVRRVLQQENTSQQ